MAHLLQVFVIPFTRTLVLQSGKLNMTCIRMLVIDEADRMTDPDNLAMVMDVFNAIPKVRAYMK